MSLKFTSSESLLCQSTEVVHVTQHTESAINQTGSLLMGKDRRGKGGQRGKIEGREGGRSKEGSEGRKEERE